jgi:hypothetical protein
MALYVADVSEKLPRRHDPNLPPNSRREVALVAGH